MPVEIRELLIKTTVDEEVNSKGLNKPFDLSENNELLKRNVLHFCKKYIDQKFKETKER